MKGHIEEETIALLAGDDLSTRKAHDLARHLAECRTCSAMLGRYREERQAITVLRDASIDAADFDSVRRSVMTRLRNQTAPRFRIGMMMRWGAVAALILTAATIGLMWRREIPAAHNPSASRPAAEAPPGRAPVPERIEAPRDIKSSAAAAVHLGTAPRAQKHSIAPNQVARSAQPLTPPPIANAQVEARPAPDRIAVKLETPDPNIIIIWLASSEGKGK